MRESAFPDFASLHPDYVVVRFLDRSPSFVMTLYRYCGLASADSWSATRNQRACSTVNLSSCFS